MNQKVALVLAFISGGVLGSLATAHLVKDEYGRRAADEIETMKMYYDSRKTYDEVLEEGIAHPVKEPYVRADVVDYTKFSAAAQKPSIEEIAKRLRTEVVVHEPSTNETVGALPFILTAGEYASSNLEQISLLYYYEDDLIVEENGEDVLLEIEDVLGDTLNHFPETEDVLYVRSPKFGIDYEIHRAEGSFMNGES